MIDLTLKINQIVHVDLSVKTVITFLWKCPVKYEHIRRYLFFLRNFDEIDCNIILYGNTDQNKDICSYLYKSF